MNLVIGFGNPLRQDDGVGWAVADALEGRADFEVRQVQQLLPELIEPLSRATRVIFVDASRGGMPGQVEEQAVVPVDTAWSGTHGLDPATLLGICRRFCGRVPEASLVSIAGARFGFGEDLSHIVRAAVPEAVRRVLEQGG